MNHTNVQSSTLCDPIAKEQLKKVKGNYQITFRSVDCDNGPNQHFQTRI